MGTDDLFHKRKAKKTADLQRESKKRPQGLRYLIVCEGSKTEPNYFREFCQIHRLLTSKVSIAPNDGSSPNRVVNCAETLYDQDAKPGCDPYDQVFCVFDRDQHDSYVPSLRRIQKLKSQKKPFVAITSVPCFEYWLLLHFIYTRQPFNVTDNQSACDVVIRELRKYSEFSNYQKGGNGIYSLLEEKMTVAIKNAQQAEEDAKQTGEDNPSTRIHYLINALQKLIRK